MSIFTKEHTPAEIVNLFPKASDLFKKYEINFCCKGNIPLQTALIEKNLDQAALLGELNRNYKSWAENDHEVTDWNEITIPEIVDHIVEKYHTFLQNELSPLEQFVTRVFFRHGEEHHHLIELHSLYLDFKTDIEAHLLKEENEVFPLIKEYDMNPNEDLKISLLEEIADLEKEHQTEVDLINRIRKITDGFQPPMGACNTYRITYARLAELEENTLQHVHIENNVLLKRLKEFTS